MVVQAQKELAKFTAAEETAETAEGSGSGETSKAAEGSADTAAASSSSSTSDDPTPSSSAATVPESTIVNTPQDTTRDTANTTHFATPTSLFARLQSALPPTIVASVQTNLASVQSNLQTNLANVQTTLTQTDLTALRAQAEELALRSEARLRDVVREAGDVLRDAVKVVPPEEADGAGGAGAGVELLGSTPGLAWDGADMWMLPGEGSSRRASTEGSRRASSASGSGAETQTSVATRAEALLRRLAREPAIARHDPEAEEGVRERYHAWRAAEGALESTEWEARIEKACEDPVDGAAVKQLEASLGGSSVLSLILGKVD